jgi:hypothetical protein
MLGLVVVSLLVVAVVTLGACDSDELTAAGRSSDDVRVLDWERGTYEGVRLGDSVARLIRVIGKPKRRGRNEPSEPIGENFYDIGGLTNYGAPDTGARIDFETFRYRRRVFKLHDGRMHALILMSPSVQGPTEAELQLEHERSIPRLELARTRGGVDLGPLRSSLG